MGVNHVEFGNNTVIDLRNDTAEAGDVRKGMLFHNRSGDLMVGTYDIRLGLIVSGVVESVDDLPESAVQGSLWLVGTDSPYTGYIWLDGAWQDAGEMTPGPKGDDGKRGFGLLFITTAPTSYTTQVGDFFPEYRILLADVIVESGAEDVYVGDILEYNYFHYPVGYVDEQNGYVYCGSRTSMQGPVGAPSAITGSSIEYQYSDSGTVIPIGAWSVTPPELQHGKYLWTRTMISFNSGDPVVSYAIAYSGVDGEGTAGNVAPLTDSGEGVVGISQRFSRQDHRHPLNVDDSVSPVMDGSGSVGTSSAYARSDHQHPAVVVINNEVVGNSTTWSSQKISGREALSFAITLAATSWSNDEQVVSDGRFLASGFVYIVSPQSSSFSDYAGAFIYADDVTVDGSMTFHCGSAPESDLSVRVVRMVKQ